MDLLVTVSSKHHFFKKHHHRNTFRSCNFLFSFFAVVSSNFRVFNICLSFFFNFSSISVIFSEKVTFFLSFCLLLSCVDCFWVTKTFSVLKFTLSALWNLTDESPKTCKGAKLYINSNYIGICKMCHHFSFP